MATEKAEQTKKVAYLVLRLPPSLKRRIKVFCARTEVSQQDWVQGLIEDGLKRKNGTGGEGEGASTGGHAEGATTPA